VNGVINIVTKSAKDTQGDLVTVTYGRDDRPEVSLRHGGELAPKVYYRASVKYFGREGFFEQDGAPRDDAWRAWHGGFRIDSERSEANTFTLQGGYFHGDFHEISVSPRLTAPFSAVEHETAKDSGANVLGRWTHRFVDAGQLTVQAYYDRASEATEDEKRTHNLYDFDAQYHRAFGARHEVVAGLGWRLIHGTLTPTPELSIANPHSDDQLFNLFVQDSIALVPDRLTLTLGAKFEHTPFTGFEYQPSGRLLWRASERQTAWAAVSRALRTPTRVELQGTVLTEVEPPGEAHLEIGNPGLKAEELIAYEFGYRVTPAKQVSFDAAVFLNEYRRLVAFEEAPAFFTTTPPPRHRVEPAIAQNSGGGRSWGMELASHWQVTPRWRLNGSYSWLRSRLSHDIDRDTPEHQFVVSTHVDLGANWAWDSSVNYFSQVAQTDTPAYARWDMGLTWRPHPALELKVVGQNLGARRHIEYEHEELLASIPRSVYGKLTWRF
jgi:iron complex outermembrane receptor protein